MRNTEELLGPAGALARSFPEYESRPGQLAMAAAVERCLAHEHTLICEAGTGTGKTLAYLVPALLSGKKVVVSTATRALQDQIFEHDLPLIEKTLGISADAALMKGLGNYICRRRYREYVVSGEAESQPDRFLLPTLRDWVAGSSTGDIAELQSITESSPLLAAVVASADTRVGSSCPHFDECFVTRMRRRAEQARIVVVNHHLFFADLALRGPHPAKVIPDYDAVIFDEAHQLEDVATNFFGARLASAALSRFFSEVERHFRSVVDYDVRAQVARATMFEHAGTNLESMRRALVRRESATQGRIEISSGHWTGELRDCWFRLDQSLEMIELEAQTVRSRIVSEPGRNTQQQTEVLELDSRRAKQYRDRLALLVEGRSGTVSWLELTPRGFVLSASPIDLAEVFRSAVFDTVPAVVLTSATLATGQARSTSSLIVGSADRAESSPFEFLRGRLGLDQGRVHVEELIVDSPFDFESRALFYTPTDLPPPGSSGYLDAAASRIVELVDIAEGGAFILTTSLRAMTLFATILRRERPERDIMVQGEGAKARLLGRFRDVTRGVLVATLGFWEGVDVPGEALRLVVLDKIPFSLPTDPIVAARARELERQGRNPFMELFIPAAAITLKQGFGRLIRRRTDYGAVALLDSRIEHKAYARHLTLTLPPAKRTRELQDVRLLFESMRSRS